jgi:MFS family permease
LLSFAIGTFAMLNIPAGQALLPNVVPREALTSAISLGTATSSFARVLGPLFAAGVVGAFGLEWVFWLNALSFLAVITAWLMTPVPRQPPIEDERNLDAARRAWRYVRTTPAVAVPIGATSFLMVVGVVYQPLAVVFATEVLAHGAAGLGREYFGWLQAVGGFGAAMGILGLAGIGRRHPSPTFAATAVAYSVSLAVLGLTRSVIPALVVMALVSTFHFANLALSINLVQHEVPEQMRGRVMSIQMTGLIGTVPITALLGALIADAVGVTTTLTGAGLICLAFSLIVTTRWRRSIRVTPVEPESPETTAAVGTLIEEEA